MKNQTRLKRLRMLRDMLKMHDKLFPKNEFFMGTWFDEEFAGCGTAACALGCAALYPPFKKMGLSLRQCSPRYEDVWGHDAGSAFFGLESHEEYQLFNTGAYENLERVTPAMVAKRVQKLIDKYRRHA